MTALERLRAAAQRLGVRVRLVLGAALAGGALGLLLGAVLPAPAAPLLPETAPGANRLVAAASGAFLGWWAGLLGGVAWLALRRGRP